MGIWDEFKKIFSVTPVNIGELNRTAIQNPPEIDIDTPKKIEIEVTQEYQLIIDWLKAKAPVVFVTGKAGTGKTTLVQYLKQLFQGNVVVVAPTGVAALQVGGVTIHSFFRFPPRIVTDDDIKIITDRKLYGEIGLLIIDEISMVRVDIIDAIDKFLQKNKGNQEPFGGVQLLMVGDLFQLPPVIPEEERKALQLMSYESPYFFSAKIFKKCALVSKELTKIYRQNDERFVSLLNQVRVAESIDEILPILNQQCLSYNRTKDQIIILACTNKVADEINDEELKKLTSPPRTFTGKTSGNFDLAEVKLPSPLNLTLKIGAQVMFTKNGGRWVNGTLGRVVGFGVDSISVEVIKDSNTQIFDVHRAKWESFKYEYDEKLEKISPVSTGYYLQYPLMLAWAVTIHKSQGKTLDKIHIDLGSGAFACGQVYVALSRCRTLGDIHLAKPIRKSDIKLSLIHI